MEQNKLIKSVVYKGMILYFPTFLQIVIGDVKLIYISLFKIINTCFPQRLGTGKPMATIWRVWSSKSPGRKRFSLLVIRPVNLLSSPSLPFKIYSGPFPEIKLPGRGFDKPNHPQCQRVKKEQSSSSTRPLSLNDLVPVNRHHYRVKQLMMNCSPANRIVYSQRIPKGQSNSVKE